MSTLVHEKSYELHSSCARWHRAMSSHISSDISSTTPFSLTSLYSPRCQSLGRTTCIAWRGTLSTSSSSTTNGPTSPKTFIENAMLGTTNRFYLRVTPLNILDFNHPTSHNVHTQQHKTPLLRGETCCISALRDKHDPKYI